MYPTLDVTGDVVLLQPMAYWRPKIWGMTNKRPERGDLVVATNMTNPA
jgi:signal peptidase I